jgi:hypothetical protein
MLDTTWFPVIESGLVTSWKRECNFDDVLAGQDSSRKKSRELPWVKESKAKTSSVKKPKEKISASR